MEKSFQGIIPIVKAEPAKNGKMVIHGVACDSSLDLQGEITDPAGIACSLGYLNEWGKLNADHSKKLVGDVVKAEILTKGELEHRGVLAKGVPQEDRNEKVLYVKGTLYQFVPEAVHFYDVLRSGGKLGFSVQGKVLDREQVVAKSAGGRPVTINRKCFINQIAVTGQPVNPGVWASIAKSLGAKPGMVGHNYILRELQKGIEAAITTGSNPVLPGDSGAGVLREQSLEGSKGSKKRRRKRRMEGKLTDYMDLDTPAQLVKAWRDEIPALVKSLGAEFVDDIATEFYDAIKANGFAASAARDKGGVTTLTKGLGEDALGILDTLDNADLPELVSIIKGEVDDEGDEEEEEDETEEPDGENEEGEESDSDEHEAGETEEEEEDEHKNDKNAKDGPIPPARKSLEEEMTADEDTGAALEIAPFLQGMTKHLSKALSDLPDQIIEGVLDVVAEGVAVGIAKAVKHVSDRLEAIEKSLAGGKTDEELTEIRKSLDEMGKTPVRPVGRYNVRPKVGDESAGDAVGGIGVHEARKIIEKSVEKGICEASLATMFDMYPAKVLADQDMLKSLAVELGK